MNHFDILKSQLQDNPPRVTVDEAIQKFVNANLNDLMHVAYIARKRIVPGNEVTYLVDRNINHTNACTMTNRQFCSFYRPPGP